MTETKLFLIAGFIAFTGLNAKAQKFAGGDESLAFLAGQTNINLEYDYDGMMVGKKTEETYKDEKIEYYNKDEPGKGDRWAEKWVNSRSENFEPMFEELINKMLAKETGISVGTNKKDAKYTIILKTILLEPGFNSYVLKVNPHCDFEVLWVETTTKKVMAKAFMDHIMGNLAFDTNWDFDMSNRIKECYAKAGKMVGKKMTKLLK